MSFRMQISARSRTAGRFISAVHREIQRAFARSEMTQQELATRLEVNRATVNKRLLGEENLTLRSIADLGWAMGLEPHFELRSPPAGAWRNYVPDTPVSGPVPVMTPLSPSPKNRAISPLVAVAADA